MSGQALSAPAPVVLRRPILHRTASHLFGSTATTAMTLAGVLLAAWLGPGILRWAVTEAVFTGPRSGCEAASGACWAFVTAQFNFILFGFYPPAERWRPALAIALVAAVMAASLRPGLWGRWLVPGWAATMLAGGFLMAGGLGLPRVAPDRWGGLPVSLMVTLAALLGGFPMGIVLALGRRSALPFVRLVCTAFIELLRGVPLISILFMVNVMVPLFLPSALAPEKLSRALLAYALAAGAYFAEAIRGGLQSLPGTQDQAARALGLGAWQTTRLVVLPQALRIAIPPIVNTVISFIKETSLVVVLGLFDLLGTVQLAARDPAWLVSGVEGYLVLGVFYLVACAAAGGYASWLERRLP